MTTIITFQKHRETAKDARNKSFLYVLLSVLALLVVVGSPSTQASPKTAELQADVSLLEVSDGKTVAGLFGLPKKTASVQKKAKTTPVHKVATPKPVRAPKPEIVLPLALATLPVVDCGPASILNFVAHEDDDLLFMNPDTLRSVQAGNCVRTVYLTAGDDARGEAYWQARQQGAEAAYSTMLGVDAIWERQFVELGPTAHIVISNPVGNPKVSLIFMNLPDGNLDGSGYEMWDRESLARLTAGAVTAIYSVDASSNYTAEQLTQTLAMFVKAYRPTEVRTQSVETTAGVGDHSDHIATSGYVAQAVARFNESQADTAPRVPLHFYVGYSIRAYAPNLNPGETAAKAAAFFSYARFDANACSSFELCQGTSYGEYLQRQYKR